MLNSPIVVVKFLLLLSYLILFFCSATSAQERNKYILEDDFSQGLLSRQDEINSSLIEYIKHTGEKEWEVGAPKELKRGRRKWLFEILKLTELRKLILIIQLRNQSIIIL